MSEQEKQAGAGMLTGQQQIMDTETYYSLPGSSVHRTNLSCKLRCRRRGLDGPLWHRGRRDFEATVAFWEVGEFDSLNAGVAVPAHGK
jgi:hypothetical protein